MGLRSEEKLSFQRTGLLRRDISEYWKEVKDWFWEDLRENNRWLLKKMIEGVGRKVFLRGVSTRNVEECLRKNLYWEWAKKWREKVPKAVNCLEKDLGKFLHFYKFPQAHWKHIRTTNILERAFREVRRSEACKLFHQPGKL